MWKIDENCGNHMVSTDYQWYLSSMSVMVEAISFSGRWLHGVHKGEDGDHAWFTVEMPLAPFNFNIF
jgi:hypothetical protein